MENKRKQPIDDGDDAPIHKRLLRTNYFGNPNGKSIAEENVNESSSPAEQIIPSRPVVLESIILSSEDSDEEPNVSYVDIIHAWNCNPCVNVSYDWRALGRATATQDEIIDLTGDDDQDDDIITMYAYVPNVIAWNSDPSIPVAYFWSNLQDSSQPDDVDSVTSADGTIIDLTSHRDVDVITITSSGSDATTSTVITPVSRQIVYNYDYLDDEDTSDTSTSSYSS